MATGTDFQEIYNAFLRKIEDNVYSQLTSTEQQEYLFGFLEDAIGMLQSESVKMVHDYTDIDKELLCFNNPLTYSEKMVLSLYMIVAWYEPKINSLETTLMFWGSKDERWQDQKKHLDGLLSTQENYRRRARKYFVQYGAKNNSYLKGEVNSET